MADLGTGCQRGGLALLAGGTCAGGGLAFSLWGTCQVGGLLYPLGNLCRWLVCSVLGNLHRWLASAALGVDAAKNLRKHARAALAGFSSFCGHAPFCNFFIPHPLTRRLASLAGLLVNTGYRKPVGWGFVALL